MELLLDMKRISILIAAFCLAFPSFCGAQIMVREKKTSPVRFEYDVDMLFHFDNREFAYSKDVITPSMTVNAIVLTPSVGFSVAQGQNASHRLMAGIDLVREMGSGQKYDVFREITVYYDAHVNLPKGRFEGIAGVFPRKYMEGEYSEAFYSDSLKFYDRNLDGVLLKYKSDRFYAELGCDWMGQAGHDRKERFEVFTAGRWDAAKWFALGWSASMYHYAGSEVAPGVVDNHKINPYLLVDASCFTGMQELSLKAGAMITYQWDRERDNGPHSPLGGEAVLTARNWNVCLKNTAYFGQNLLYYYNSRDLGGAKYGNDLYRGQPFYTGFYDRAEVSWNPRITDWCGLELSARMHFSRAGFLGWQQVLSLTFDLDALRNPTVRSGAVGSLPAVRRKFRIKDLFNL